MSGLLPYSRMKGYGGNGYSVGDAWSLDIAKEKFPEMLAAIPSMAQRCVSVLLNRVREVTRIEMQAEKLTALGKLAANLAHELNNPASAAQRSAASLFGELRQFGDLKQQLGAALAAGRPVRAVSGMGPPNPRKDGRLHQPRHPAQQPARPQRPRGDCSATGWKPTAFPSPGPSPRSSPSRP